MNSTFMDQYFGPLPREYCVYFYVLSIIFGVMFAVSAVSIAYFMITHIKKINTMFVVNSIFILLNTFLAYLVNRLLHTMCVKAI
jgi:hypothetical protein